MLMGEYDFHLNFITNESASFMSKFIFIVFVIDMSVVLMNLVLGLAVSDIEELQRNSAVRRMIQETCGVIFMENVFLWLSKLPGCHRLASWLYHGSLEITFGSCIFSCLSAFFSTRITNDRTFSFEEVVYLDLVDLDQSPKNTLVIDTFGCGVAKKAVWTCPHHIVANVQKIVKEKVNATVLVPMEDKEFKEVKKNQEALGEKLNEVMKLLAEKA